MLTWCHALLTFKASGTDRHLSIWARVPTSKCPAQTTGQALEKTLDFRLCPDLAHTVKTTETTPSRASHVLSPALWQPPWRDWWSRMCCLGPPGNKCQKPATNMAPQALSAVQLPTNTYKTTIQRVWKWSWGQRTDEAISSQQNL